VIWSLTASTIIRNQIKGSELRFWSYVCNFVGIATPILTIIASLTLAILGGIKYSTAVGAYDKLNAFFIDESLIWSPTNLTNRFYPPSRELVDNFEANLEGIEKWWRMSFLFSGILGAALTAAVIVVAVLYLFSLRKNVVKMGQTLDTTAYARAEGSQPHLKSTWTVSSFSLLPRAAALIVSLESTDVTRSTRNGHSLLVDDSRSRILRLSPTFLVPLSHDFRRNPLHSTLPLIDTRSRIRNRHTLQCFNRTLFFERCRERVEDCFRSEMDDAEEEE